MTRERLQAAGSDPRGGDAADDREGVLLSWSVHPLRTYRRRSLALVLLPVAWGFFLWAGGITGLLLSVVFSLVAISGYLLPTEYALTRDGVRIRNALSSDLRLWSDFASFRAYPDAVQLIYRRRTLRDALLHGIVLFVPDRLDEVVAVLERFLPRAEDGPARRGGPGGARVSVGGPGGSGPAAPHPNGRVRREPVRDALRAGAREP